MEKKGILHLKIYNFTTPDDFFCAMDGNNTYAGNPKVVLYPVRPIRAFTDD